MKTRDGIYCCGLPDTLRTALEEAFSHAFPPEVAFVPAAAEAALVLHAQGAALPVDVSPAVPRLALDLSRPHRLGEILRRARQALETPAFYLDDFLLGDALLQPQEKNLRAADGGDIALTDKEVDILICLARQGGRVLRRDDLLRRIWRYQPGVDTHTLETHVYRLRQKLAGHGALDALLLTDDDGGYRLSAPARRDEGGTPAVEKTPARS